MRRAVLAILLCAAPLATVPPTASADLRERQALREVLRTHARGGGPVALPLNRSAQRAVAATTGELSRVARATGPQRILVGVRSRRHLPGVAALLRRLGATPETFGPIGVLGAEVRSGVEGARALGSDRRVAYVERDGRLGLAADPFDGFDPAHGYNYTWFYDEVRAGQAITAAGGGSRRTVAVMDTGLDVNHPELTGRFVRRYDTLTRGTDVTDLVGHGTFVSGLISGIDGNGYGAKGVAGDTRLLAIRASRDGTFTESDLLRGINFALRRGGDILNLSLAGDGLAPSVERALGRAFLNDVLPVAASGNLGATAANPPQFPARILGGRRGATGIGLSVSATRPTGAWAEFSTHNPYVSLAAPGAGADPSDPNFGVFSALPAAMTTDWDTMGPAPFTQGGARFAYGEGTSFAAPIASGIAALAWHVEPRLASEQVAEVLTSSARQTMGTGWNRYTGAGVVDGEAATALARVYDVTPPRARGRARRAGAVAQVRVIRTRDRTERGRRRANGARFSLFVSRDGGRTFGSVVGGRRRGFTRSVALRGPRPNVLVASACDANGNCTSRRLGRYRP